MTDPAPSPKAAGLSRNDIFSVLGALGAILTLITAVLFYFGWRRSEAQSRAMSIDVSLFGFTSQDYVLRSISSLYVPLLLLSVLGLVWIRLHRRAAVWLAKRAALPESDHTATLALARWISVAAALLGLACIAFTIAAGYQDPLPIVGWLSERLSSRRWVVPALLLCSVLVIAYCRWVRRVLVPGEAFESPPWMSMLSGALAAVVVILSTFWILEEYAAAVGRGYAQQLVAGVDQLPRATVISPAPLGIEAPGVTQERVDDQGSVFYRTSGMRLLARSGSKIILVHDGWRPGSGEVVVLPDSDGFNWEFSR